MRLTGRHATTERYFETIYFGASEATIFSKRGSLRSGKNRDKRVVVDKCLYLESLL
jgi:hypothetical protein